MGLMKLMVRVKPAGGTGDPVRKSNTEVAGPGGSGVGVGGVGVGVGGGSNGDVGGVGGVGVGVVVGVVGFGGVGVVVDVGDGGVHRGASQARRSLGLVVMERGAGQPDRGVTTITHLPACPACLLILPICHHAAELLASLPSNTTPCLSACLSAC